ncbi:hypothetical protein [Mucilaginibacter sp. SP1R1]|uniref:hypothetical protein n=1 Tax=Mucilaginibacter sp. SP1R1 TaxID=2723091 RepID=UPI00160A2832|nr:hypothetical protein [Mucilaginibacter sp. SP1R1]MBB6152457.1 hypothetical protein [Mucilaginibacter sp. SP1R1]
MIAQNYKVFNEPGKVKMTWVYCLIATAVIFAGAFLVPETVKIPKIIIPLIYSWATYYLVQQLQGAQIDTHVKAGGEIYSWWRAIGISLIGVVITFAIIFVILLFLPNS